MDGGPFVRHEGARLVETTSVPVFYCDGHAQVIVRGGIARITYFEYRRIGGEWVKFPVLEMIRPLASCGTGHLKAMVMQEVGPKGADGVMDDCRH